jgi:hypothetical protein
MQQQHQPLGLLVFHIRASSCSCCLAHQVMCMLVLLVVECNTQHPGITVAQ